MYSFLLFLLYGYALAVGLLTIYQRRLIYCPDRKIETPDHYGLVGFSEHFAVTPDHEKIQLWYREAHAGFPTVFYMHGNSYNLADRAAIFSALAEKGFGVLAVGYRGYGKSTGWPSEQGLYIDARTGISFLTERNIPLSNILLFGESLGTGVAVQMATEFATAGLILQSPYISVAKRAAEIYFYVPVRYLIFDKFDSLNKIARVKAPLLVFHGERDKTIPIRQGKAVFDAATSPKQSYYYPEIAHYDFDSKVVSAQVLEFAKEHGLIVIPA